MFPAYGYKHAYPQVRAQMPADCRHHPTSEGLPPQMKMGASPSPFQFETWPPYPLPTQCHSCCNHNSYPNYYPYRPPYPHFPSPPHHLQCYGGYPAYPVHPEPHPFQFVPPPHYTMEPPNYEYYNSLPRDSHCCGCHHHMPNMKGDKGVKIEEQESEAENREDSSVPSGFNNIRHPIVWIPPEYKKDQESPSGAKPRQSVWNGWPPLDYESIKRMLEGGDGRRSQDQLSKHMEAADHQETPSVMPQKDLKSVEQEPNFPRGWLPLDMDSLKKLLQNGNLKGDHENQPTNQSHQMPFPVIWLPHNNKEKEASTVSESSFRQQPFKPEQGDDHTQKSIPPVGVESGEGGKKLLEKHDRPPQAIPVKQMDEAADMKTNSGQQTKNIEESKKSTENGTKSKTTSPTKASKLPPVCLRVDPLPKKKNGQGKTRSPSPPGDKVQQVNALKSSSISENKVHQDTKGLKIEAEKKSAEVPQGKTEINIVDMEDGSHSVEIEKPSKHEEVQEAVGKKPEEDLKPEKRILSGTEAATIIQSAYRGYEVRRLEPLKKMRQIANICDEAAAVKRSIESGTNSMDLKQKAALGETIMNLLLKLDTVQGLHASIRDFRKSVVKQLVSLQEMLDTTEVKQPDHSPDDTGAVGATMATIQTTDESSLRPGITEAETGETEDQQGVEMEENAKDQISTSKELPAEEPSTVPDLLSPEQALPERDIIEKGAAEVGEEAGSPLSDSHGQQNELDVKDVAAVDNLAETVEAHEPSGQESTPVVPEEVSVEPIGQESGHVVTEVHVDSEDQTDIKAHEPIGQESTPVVPEEASVEPIGQESGPVVTELHVDSADQTDMKHDHDLLTEVPLSVMEEDVPNEGSEPHVIEPEKPEHDDSSKAKISIEQDAESAIPDNALVPDNEGEKDVNLTEPKGNMKVECPPIEANDRVPVADENTDNTHNEGNHEDETTKPAEDERMRLLLEKLIESEKQQQEIISSLTEKLKDLEGKLAKQKQQKKKKSARTRRARVFIPRSCKPSTGFSKEDPMALAS